MIKNFILNLTFILFFKTNFKTLQEECTSSLGTFSGICQDISECTGGAFESTCLNNKICCVNDPELEKFSSSISKNIEFPLDAFLYLSGDTTRNKALYPIFLNYLQDSEAITCHMTAAFYSQLAGETNMFTKLESILNEADFAPVLGKTKQYPESVAFPSTAFRIASLYWKSKKELNTLADGSYFNFTMQTYYLTKNQEEIKLRFNLYKKAVQILKCSEIKQGIGEKCKIGEEKGLIIANCFDNFKRSYCGCNGKFYKSCVYGFDSKGNCLNSPIIGCCIEGCKRKLDLAILMDSSASIRLPQFIKQKNFIKNLLNRLEISLELIRVSLVKFSTDVEIVGIFSNFTGTDTICKVIDKIEHASGLTSTATALKITNEIIFQEENEKEISKIVLVITDGKSTDAPGLTVPYAQEIKDRGINVICLGIGKQIDMNELEGMASSKDYVFLIDTFDQFGLIIEALVRTTCEQLVNSKN